MLADIYSDYPSFKLMCLFLLLLEMFYVFGKLFYYLFTKPFCSNKLTSERKLYNAAKNRTPIKKYFKIFRQ